VKLSTFLRHRICMLVGSFLAAGITISSQAHDEHVHQELSRSSFLSSASLAAFLSDNLDSTAAPFDTQPLITVSPFGSGEVDGLSRSPMDWLALGAYMEDMGDPPLFGQHFLRSTDHFYTLLRDRNHRMLTDSSESPFGKLPSPLADSFLWATFFHLEPPTLAGSTAGYNQDTWGDARFAEYEALTFSQKNNRDAMIGAMLFKLGHVLHLNQDLSQPEHVRNDEHNKHHAIEKRGLEILNSAKQSQTLHDVYFPLRSHGWPFWQNCGFNKLEDFWDRGHYVGDAAALADDKNPDYTVAPSYKLGLAEFCNGNFLGQNALYGDTFSKSDEDYNLHYFPFPSIYSSTAYSDFVSSHYVASQGFVRDGSLVNRYYLKKAFDGYVVQKHSALGYLPSHRRTQRPTVIVSINDQAVLDEYHSIMLPKAIEYSAGILDYFFRGNLDTSTTLDNVSGKYSVHIINKSGQALQGGAFHLFYDVADGTRTEITGSDFTYTLSSPIADGGSIDATVTPQSAAKSYILVYQGNIGTTDPVDAGIAVAATTLECVPEIGSPTPDSLSVPVNNVVVGEIDLPANGIPVSFPSVGPGKYEIKYVSGHITTTLTEDGGTFCPLGTTMDWTEATILQSGAVPKFAFPEDGTFLRWTGNGETSCDGDTAAQVEAYTLAQQAHYGPYCTTGGVIQAKLDYSGGICCCLSCNTTSSGSLHLQLVQTSQSQILPQRIRLRNAAKIFSALSGACTTCVPLAGPEWDGSFPIRSYSCDECYYDMNDDFDDEPIGGKRFYAEVWFASGTWQLQIASWDGQTYQVTWQGSKNINVSPAGRYTQDSGWLTGLSCIVLDEY
jgi:hypothetical protein